MSSKPSATHRLDIDDVFGPSSFDVVTEEPDELNLPRTRMILHNSHIVSRLVPNALEAANILGCPLLLPNLSLASKQESKDLLGDAIIRAGEISDLYEQSSIEWLCLKIYAHFAHVALSLKQGYQLENVAHFTIVLGATARELELAILHRKTVEDRKKALHGLLHHNEDRKVRNEERRQEANRKMAHAQQLLDSFSSTNLTNSSLARLIYENWHARGETEPRLHRPAKRTIENWLSSKKVSRA